MTTLEQTELQNHRRRIDGDVQDLFDKYRTIFDWDIPDIDQQAADALILAEIRKSLDEIATRLTGAPTSAA